MINKNTYFLSDFHLGTPNAKASLERELRICHFLDSIMNDAKAVYLVGDIFDFWFEYKTVVPKGFLRFFSRLVKMKELGIEVVVFTGNHDLWMQDYFETELQIPVHFKPIQIEIDNKKFFIGHGDGLGPGDKGFKLMKKVFTNQFCQWLFRWLHPDIGVGIANYWSRRSRIATAISDEKNFGEKEWLVQYAKRKLETNHYDYFIFGHRHLPLDITLNSNSRYFNIGDWLRYNSYVKFDGQNCQLKFLEQ
ncbi:MAG: UDP-2,3-diacylglucosamine hydrolase [Bacteroidota bacterium]